MIFVTSAQPQQLPQRGHGSHDANGSIIRWCFADAGIANAFASEFER